MKLIQRLVHSINPIICIIVISCRIHDSFNCTALYLCVAGTLRRWVGDPGQYFDSFTDLLVTGPDHQDACLCL